MRLKCVKDVHTSLVNSMKNFFKKVFTKENMKKFFYSFVWLMVLMFVIDIVTKWVVVNHFGVDAMNNGIRHEDKNVITIIKDFCYIGGAINNKAAFSLGPHRVVLLIISLVMSAGFIAFYIIQYKKLNTVYKLSLALMISGAVGNLIDRAFYWPSTTGFDGVVDWIIFVFGGWEFAMFNIADSCLVVGIIIILIEMIIEEIKEAKKKAKRGEYKYSPEQLEKKNKDAETKDK